MSTLVVDLGLSRLPPLIGFEILRTLIAGGHSTQVRELIGDRVFEITRDDSPWESKEPPFAVTSRWLTSEETTPILTDAAKLRDQLATFDRHTLAGFWDVHDLAAVLDGPKLTNGVMGGKRRYSIIDLEQAAHAWRGTKGTQGLATKLHAIAKKHRLVVHRG